MIQLVGDQFHLLQHGQLDLINCSVVHVYIVTDYSLIFFIAQLYGLQLITELLKHLRKMTLLNTLALVDKGITECK